MENFDHKHPLWQFSPYLWGRVRVLMILAQDIRNELDGAFSSTLQMDKLGRAEANLWLWCLGSYEMVRTMTQAQALSCFSSRVQEALKELKRELEEVRMPAAKMELKKPRGSRFGRPVTSNRAPAAINAELSDLLVGNPDNLVSGRALLTNFENVFYSIEPQDIVGRHEDGYTS